MTMPNNAKALVGAVITALGTTAAAAVPGSSGVGTNSTITSAILGLASYIGVWWTTNGGSPKAAVKDAAQGLVVMAQVDGSAFLNYLMSKAPDLLAGAVQAALKGSPSPSVPATTTVIHNYAAAPSADTAPAAGSAVEPAILGKAATPADGTTPA